MSYDYAREIDDARSFDLGDDAQMEAADCDDDSPAAGTRYSCSDGMCGCTDCANCYPGHRYTDPDDECGATELRQRPQPLPTPVAQRQGNVPDAAHDTRMNAQGIDTDAATIEPQLDTLIREHGLATVEAHLAILLGAARWRDWQRVANIARNVAARIGVR